MINGPMTIPVFSTLIFFAFAAFTVTFIFIDPNPKIKPASLELSVLCSPGFSDELQLLQPIQE